MANGLYAAIAQGGQPLQIENPLNEMAKIMAVKNAMAESQLNALTLSEKQKDIEATNALAQLAKSGIDLKSPEARRKAYEISPTFGMKFEKSQAELEKSGLETRKLKSEVTAQDLKASRERLNDLYVNPSNENILAHLQDDIIKGLMTPEQAVSKWKRYETMAPEARKNEFLQLKMGVDEYAKQNKPQLTTQDLGGSTRILATPGLGGAATVVPGSAAGKSVSPDTAARLAQERDVELQAKIAKAKEYGQTVGKSTATTEAALPGAIATANQTIGLIDQMIGTPTVKDKTGKVIKQGTAPMPGFQDYVGATWRPGMRFIEGSDAANFERYQKQIEGTAFLQAYETLKGGGAITEVEGAKGTQALMRMNKAQNEKEYVKAAREFQDVLRKGVERMREKTGATSTAPAVDIHEQARRIIEGR